MQAQKTNKKATTAPQNVDANIVSVHGGQLEVVHNYREDPQSVVKDDVKKLTRFSKWRAHDCDEFGGETLWIRNGRTDVTNSDDHFVERRTGTVVAGFLRKDHGNGSATVEPIPEHLKDRIMNAVKGVYKGIVLFGQELPAEF